jgi:mRNA-degrading endonuclease YafQ of YafQ-DinJ toxin-antitoxin module
MAHKFITGRTYVPGIVRDRWEMYDYFDKLEYLKASRMYEMTGMSDYAKQMGESMTGISPMRQGIGSMTAVARAVPNEIKPYIFSFMGEKDPGERERIASTVPGDVANLLRVKWALMDKDRGAALEVANAMNDSNDLTTYYRDHHLPGEESLVWNPNINLDDVMVKTVENEGMSAHDFGHGWFSQARRIKYSPHIPGPIDISDPTGLSPYPSGELDVASARSIIRNILTQFGISNPIVNVRVTPGMGSRVTMNINMNQIEEVERHLQLEGLGR